jgi:hypothetical protein
MEGGDGRSTCAGETSQTWHLNCVGGWAKYASLTVPENSYD